MIDIALARGKAAGRTIAVYAETKNPSYHRDLGLPLEDKLIAALDASPAAKNTIAMSTRSAPVLSPFGAKSSLTKPTGPRRAHAGATMPLGAMPLRATIWC